MKKIITILLIFSLGSINAQNIVIFDGEGKKQGGAWADPKDSVTLGITDKEKFNGKSTLELKAKCKNWWGGGGWNWHNWTGPGDDITKYDYLSFRVKKSAGALNDLWIQLADSKNKVSSKVKIVKDGYCKAIGEEFAKVAIPLNKFTGEFNKKAITSMNIAVAPVAADGSCTVNIAQVELCKGPQPAKPAISTTKKKKGASVNPAAIPTKSPADWKKWKIKEHKARAEKGNINVLFIGDSITRLWSKKEVGLTAWNKNFAPMGAAEFGVSGDKTQEILWRLSEGGELDNVKPKVIVYLGGVNNIFTNETPDNVAGGIKATIDYLHKRLPESKIILIGLLPTGFTKGNTFHNKNKAVNEKIGKFADGKKVFYLNLESKFLNSDGSLKKEAFNKDGVHPCAKGYEIFAANLKPEVEKLLK